jgi:NAD(P)-dependent dehydrogenase (short-subunit alcohol dehydrogenase family)
MSKDHWNLQQVGDLRGRKYLVTGANGGIGYYVAAQLLDAGAALIMAGRNPKKIDAASDTLVASGHDARRIEQLVIDTSSIASSKAAAAQLDQSMTLDGIVLNAGLVRGPKQRKVTDEGHELLFATNLVGHFAFVGSVLPKLKGISPRVVWMGSSTAFRGSYDFTDPESTTDYAPMKTYAFSKAAVTMVAVEAERRLSTADSAVTSVIAHPGYSLGGRSPRISGVNEPTAMQRILDTLQAPLSQTKEEGAHSAVRALVDPLVKGAQLVGPAGYRGPTRLLQAPEYTQNREAGERLWNYLENATGVNWP